MITKRKYNGFAIALAWPATYCKQPGSWYDPITLFLGINKNNYYKVGHAAIVLVDGENKKFHYFDFGRYHAPFGQGRVRGADTDDDLLISTIPKISDDGKNIENFKDLLKELQNNPSCHGEGNLFASYIPINFKNAFKKAMQMQNKGPITYGPFRKNASNCSRFVNTVLLVGKPQWKYQFRLKYLIPLTPTPISNVNSLEYKLVLPKFLKTKAFYPIHKLDNELLNSTLKQPNRLLKIPENAQWLSGEGAGSWFDFNITNKQLHVNRFSPDGNLECSGLYENPEIGAHLLSREFKITYPSNCKTVTFLSKGEVLSFMKASK